VATKTTNKNPAHLGTLISASSLTRHQDRTALYCEYQIFNKGSAMKITFGMSLDGYEPPELHNKIGAFVTGPMGLLDLLETRLGLGGEWPVQSLRVVQYQQCLVDAGAALDEALRSVDLPISGLSSNSPWRPAA
jgi:hypothetical protein